jgi:DNA-binding NtrC family response regulator
MQCSCGEEEFEVWVEDALRADAGRARIACKSCGQQWSSVIRSAGALDDSDAARENPFEVINLAEPNRRRLDALLTELERRAIRFTLAQASGNRSHAARTLGISRSRLYRRMEALGIAPEGSEATDLRVPGTSVLTGEPAEVASV